MCSIFSRFLLFIAFEYSNVHDYLILFCKLWVFVPTKNLEVGWIKEYKNIFRTWETTVNAQCNVFSEDVFSVSFANVEKCKGSWRAKVHGGIIGTLCVDHFCNGKSKYKMFNNKTMKGRLEEFVYSTLYRQFVLYLTMLWKSSVCHEHII